MLSVFLSELQIYNGDDYNGARIVSRAYELRDAVSFLILLSCFSYFLVLWPIVYCENAFIP